MSFTDRLVDIITTACYYLFSIIMTLLAAMLLFVVFICNCIKDIIDNTIRNLTK